MKFERDLWVAIDGFQTGNDMGTFWFRIIILEVTEEIETET